MDLVAFSREHFDGALELFAAEGWETYSADPERTFRALSAPGCTTVLGVAGGEFALYQSGGAPSGEHTQMGFEVEDIDAAVAELRQRGVVFEEYDFPGLTTVGGIADIEGNYPSKGTGERGAWFRDSEGNMLGLGQPVR